MMMIDFGQPLHSQVLCDVDIEIARELNTNRCEAEKYNDEIFKDLIGRFEPPNPNNRWDSPLFIVRQDNAHASESNDRETHDTKEKSLDKSGAGFSHCFHQNWDTVNTFECWT